MNIFLLNRDITKCAYSNYYINDKADLLTYTKRPKPEWLDV
jgi:hypothetical protein